MFIVLWETKDVYTEILVPAVGQELFATPLRLNKV